MNKFRVILWIVPLYFCVLVEAIVKAVANIVLAIFYPVLKNKFNFYYWCKDWKEYKVADYICNAYDLYW